MVAHCLTPLYSEALTLSLCLPTTRQDAPHDNQGKCRPLACVGFQAQPVSPAKAAMIVPPSANQLDTRLPCFTAQTLPLPPQSPIDHSRLKRLPSQVLTDALATAGIKAAQITSVSLFVEQHPSLSFIEGPHLQSHWPKQYICTHYCLAAAGFCRAPHGIGYRPVVRLQAAWQGPTSIITHITCHAVLIPQTSTP